MITTQRLRDVFDYSDGKLIRKVATAKRHTVGEVVGFVNPNGYVYAAIDRRTYSVHRLIWLMHGNADCEFLDHIDGDTGNNRIENLREATHAQNQWNKRLQKNNTTGVKGIIWKKDKRKYRVRIGVNGRRIHIGDFADLELAELVAHEARNKFHGHFARH